MFSLQRLLKSFKTAFEGLVFVFKTEPNFRIQILFAFLALAMAYIFNLRTVEWIVIIVLIMLVLVMEILNTALEQFTDLLKPRLHHYVKDIKDVMAAAVLLTSLGALLIGTIIFWPHIFLLMNGLI